MATTTWHTTPPTAPGLYIASTGRNAGFVRYWTGKHWTAPLSVMDLHLTDRIPNAQGGKADTCNNRRVQWLEAVTIDADGFISWGGLLDTCPVPPGMPVEVKMRAYGGEPVRATPGLRWARLMGGGGDILAYRVVPDDLERQAKAAVTGAANDWMFTPWTNATPPEVGWWHTRGEQVRHWDGHAWSEPLHESTRYEGARCLPMPPRDALAIPGSVTWRWWTVEFFDDMEGSWDVDDCGNVERVPALDSWNRARAARVECMHEAFA